MNIKLTMTFSRTLSLEAIKEEYGERLALEEGDDPMEVLIEYMNDNGLEFFEEEDQAQWDHTPDAVPVK
jgi:hypothetical protein